MDRGPLLSAELGPGYPPPVIASHNQAVTTAAELADAFGSGAAARDQSGELPRDQLAELDRSGLLGITVPKSHGGPELSMSTVAEVIRLLAAADPSIAQIPQGHFLFVDALRVLGTETQQKRLFTDIQAGGRLAATMAERGGAHAQDLQTTLRPNGNRLCLEGRKYYCTGALTARWLAVTALQGDDLVAALVPRDAPGVALDDDWGAMGQRGTVSGTTTFTAVPVDAELVLPYGRVFNGPQQLGARAQLIHAAIEAGIACGALEDARSFLTTRARPFFEAARGGWGERAVDDPHTALRYGRLATEVRATLALLGDAARTLDEVGLVPADADAAARGSLAGAQAKAFASETAVRVASDLFALSGASATDRARGLDRHWRNARTHSVHDPVDWKYHHVGAYELAGILPPNHGQL